MKKEQIIQLRKEVQYYCKQGMKVSAIMRKVGVSKPFVIKWKNKDDAEEDKRGWKKGNKRKFSNKQEKIVIQKRKELEENFFLDPKRFLTK